MIFAYPSAPSGTDDQLLLANLEIQAENFLAVSGQSIRNGDFPMASQTLVNLTSSGFAVALLTPPLTAAAEIENARHLGPQTLGVEVTDAGMARRCGLGNIDPQHGFGHGREACAIEAALAWPVPPVGATLVTLRADADALGAMAVLSLRAAGVNFTKEMQKRIALVSRCDSFSFGDWQAWREARGPLPRPATAQDVTLFPPDYVALTAALRDPAHSLKARVAVMIEWLLHGTLADGAVGLSGYAEALAYAWNSGGLTVHFADDPRIVRLRWSRAGGLQLGYRFGPVVIARTYGFAHRAVAIGQFCPGYLDLTGVRATLCTIEAGWGGSASLLCSPQGLGTHLPHRVIERAVIAALDKRASSRSSSGDAQGGRANSAPSGVGTVTVQAQT